MTDLRYAARWLLMHPGFSGIVILTMALGIAANAAVFSVADALFLRPLPVRHAERLALVDAVGEQGRVAFSVNDLAAMRREARGFEGLAAHGRGGSIFRDSAAGGTGADTWIIADYVAGPYFETLGISAQRGRVIAVADEATVEPAPIVLSDTFWRQHFARDEAVLGRIVSINGDACIIVGVAPASFFGLMAGTSPDVWAPVSLVGRAFDKPATTARPPNETRWLRVFGSLAPDAAGSVAASREAARLSLGQIWQQRDKVLAAKTPIVGPLTPWQQAFAKRYLNSLQVLGGLVAVLLLVACVNVISLVMTRAAGRQKEIAIRVALGVGRARLIRQVLAEYLLLAGVALIIALPLSGWLASWLVSLGSQPYLPMILSPDPDRRLLLFAAGLTFGVGLTVGIWPAIRALRVDPNTALHATAATVGSARLRRLSGAWLLLPVQIALGVILLVAASLFVQTLGNLRRGMQDVDPRHLIFASVSMEATGVVGRDAGHGRDIAQQVVERANTLPGVEHAALIWLRPLADFLQGPVSIGDAPNEPAAPAAPGAPAADAGAGAGGKIARLDWVSPHYFETIGMTLRRGRDFTFADKQRGTGDPVIVNERLVEQVFGRRDADVIGRTIRWGRPSSLAQIVGVVSDTHLNDLQRPPQPIVYLPIAGRDASGFELVVRTHQPTGVAVEQLRRTLHDIDPQLPLVRAWTFEQEMANALSKEQMIASVASVFGTLALLLVEIGVFGALSYAVARRSRELAIRVALGASPLNLRSLVLHESLTVAILGLAAGLPLAWLAARTLATMLNGVHAADPLTLTGVAIVVVAVTTLAAYLPARRAARTDPIAALRAE